MAKTTELPEMVSEFIDLSKQYIREQTIEPAKKLGRLAGFSFAGAFVIALSVIFLAVAATRVIVWAMPAGPEHAMWTGLGYIISSFALLIVTGIMMWRLSR